MRYGADGELDIDDFIYRIEAGGHIYIGQSKRGHGNNRLGTGNRLTEHFKEHKHDYHSQRGLMKKVGRRKKLLDYLKKNDVVSYREVIKKLNLRK